MADTLDRPWWEAYRKYLEQSFSQDETVICAVAITRLLTRQFHFAICYHFYDRGADGSKTAALSVIPVKARSVMATFDAQAVAQLLREFAGRSSLRGGKSFPGQGLCPRCRQPLRIGGAVSANC